MTTQQVPEPDAAEVERLAEDESETELMEYLADSLLGHQVSWDTDAQGWGFARDDERGRIARALLTPVLDLLSRKHDDCPEWCDECNRWERRRSCQHCNGSGCGPGTASGAYEECEWCAGDGRDHATEPGHDMTLDEMIARALCSDHHRTATGVPMWPCPDVNWHYAMADPIARAVLAAGWVGPGTPDARLAAERNRIADELIEWANADDSIGIVLRQVARLVRADQVWPEGRQLIPTPPWEPADRDEPGGGGTP